MSETEKQVAGGDALPAGLHFDDAQAQADQESLKAALDSAGQKLGQGNIPIAPIGGQLISSVGGLVGFCPMGGNAIAGITAPTQVVEFTGTAPPTVNQTNYLDVARWMPNLSPAIDDVTQTTAWAQAVAVTLAQGDFTIEVINDHRVTPAMLAKYGLINPQVNANLSLNLGCRMTLLHGNPNNYPSLSNLEGNNAQPAPDFYYCPSVKLLNPGMVIDAINKKMVRSMMRLIANAPVFHMPYEFANLTAYLAHLVACYQGF